MSGNSPAGGNNSREHYENYRRAPGFWNRRSSEIGVER
jgi:hypothetical protein